MKRLKLLKRPALPSGKSRLCFYREDLHTLQKLLARLTADHAPEGCILYSARYGVIVARHGLESLTETDLRGRRLGVSVKWGLRLAGVTVKDHAAEVRDFLKAIADRREFGPRITTLGRPSSPGRA
jgi:hypothetical protein